MSNVLKVGSVVMFMSPNWSLGGGIYVSVGEKAVVKEVEESGGLPFFVKLRHPSRIGQNDSSSRGWTCRTLLDRVEVFEPGTICLRDGCDNPPAYRGAEYCGAACSEQRREPKKLNPGNAALGEELVDELASKCVPQRHPLANIEHGPGIAALDLRPVPEEPFKSNVSEWDLLADVDVHR